jgi:hypothetical protein
MKTTAIITIIATALCLCGCSKETASSKGDVPGIVPATAAEVIASPQFKLEHTTRSGVKCYTRVVTSEEYRAISEKSADRNYLNGREPFAFFLVPIRDGKIIKLTDHESLEVSRFVMSKTLSAPGMMQPGGR